MRSATFGSHFVSKKDQVAFVGPPTGCDYLLAELGYLIHVAGCERVPCLMKREPISHDALAWMRYISRCVWSVSRGRRLKQYRGCWGLALHVGTLEDCCN